MNIIHLGENAESAANGRQCMITAKACQLIALGGRKFTQLAITLNVNAKNTHGNEESQS